MTPNTAPRSARRNAKSAAIGAVALTAAVALPAFAIDRGGDGAVDAATAADAVESTTTTTTTSTRPSPPGSRRKAVERVPRRARHPHPGAAVRAAVAGLDRRAAGLVRPARRRAAGRARVVLRLVSWSHRARPRPPGSPGRQRPGRLRRGSVWDRLAQCETGGNWSHPTVSGGFSGGLMFHSATWNANGGRAYAATASRRHPRAADRRRRAHPRQLRLGRLARLLPQARPALIGCPRAGGRRRDRRRPPADRRGPRLAQIGGRLR